MQYVGVGYMGNTYAATFSYLINISASLLISFPFTTILKGEQSSFP